MVTIGNTVYALGGKDVHQSGQEEPINSVDISTFAPNYFVGLLFTTSIAIFKQFF